MKTHHKGQTSGALSEIIDGEKVVRELHRTLKNGGRAVIMIFDRENIPLCFWGYSAEKLSLDLSSSGLETLL